MIRILSFALCISLLASCGEKKSGRPRGSETSSKSPRSETRSNRDPEPGTTASKRVLRESFESALASTDPEVRSKVLGQVAWDAIDIDPELSRQAFAELPADSPERAKLAAHFAMRLAESDPDQALAWARGLDSSEREEALSRISVVIGAKDPGRAAELMTAEIEPGRPRDRAAVQLAQRWSQADPSAAAEWLGTLPAGDARSAGLKLALVRWLGEDASAAASWITSRTDEALGLESLAAVADHLRSAEASEKAAALAAFSDPEIRRRLENLLAQPGP